MSFAAELSVWARGLRFDDLPTDVVAATRLRVLDTIGLMVAGTRTQLGQAARNTAVVTAPSGPCRILGFGDKVGATAAAFANGASSQALQYDETHIESIVHMSSPVIAAALAVADWKAVSGRELIVAIALGNEIACRVGCVAPGQFHKRGLHPTGLFSTFGTAYLASYLLGLDKDQMVRASGIAGSFASGLLQCWVDGTETQFLHPGWSAQGGITAAILAREGATGPSEVFEGRMGFFASHLQDETIPRTYRRITDRLGDLWESRASSFKPYPVAHVIHPYIDALLRLAKRHGITADAVEKIECPVAPYIVPIVCEPVSEKMAPASDFQGRVSLQYTLAEALVTGALGRDAYKTESLRDPRILALAQRVHYRPDASFPGPGQFKGQVILTLRDGRSLSDVEEFTRGSLQNPMSPADLRSKFDSNVEAALPASQAARLADAISKLETLTDVRQLIDLAVPA
jgi:2-methylcitrate dehydratase PrpD